MEYQKLICLFIYFLHYVCNDQVIKNSKYFYVFGSDSLNLSLQFYFVDITINDKKSFILGEKYSPLRTILYMHIYQICIVLELLWMFWKNTEGKVEHGFLKHIWFPLYTSSLFL